MAQAVQLKDTWWNKLRVEQNMPYKELASYMDCGISKVCEWFTGAKLPDRDVIYKLCDWFSVEYGDGEEHFIADHENYVAEATG